MRHGRAFQALALAGLAPLLMTRVGLRLPPTEPLLELTDGGGRRFERLEASGIAAFRDRVLVVDVLLPQRPGRHGRS